MLWWQALGKLAFFVIFLPALLTYVHLRHVTHREGFVLVGPGPSSSTVDTEGLHSKNDAPKEHLSHASLYGIYSPTTLRPGAYEYVQAASLASGNANGSSRSFVSPYFGGRWPSVAEVSILLAQARFVAPTLEYISPIQRSIVYDANTSQWCLVVVRGTRVERVCSETNYGTNSPTVPASGIWTTSMTNRTHQAAVPAALSVSYMGPTAEDTKARRRKSNKTRQNKNIEHVTRRPATTLLMAINILLALWYWNYRVPPSSVAKNYDKIRNDLELWRAFSGALAHFEPLHLGFNMMALLSLGTELEEMYGSIAFFFYNISLIILTTSLLMVGWYLQERYRARTNPAATPASTNTVGYSGVLFAWMVIASLERQTTCPVFFVPDLCFQTYSWHKLKFNISPLIQLAIAQVIMPRVSFLGHLAGIVCGFLLHWHVLPLEYVQPSVLIPSLMLVVWWRRRRIIPVRRDESDGEEQAEEANLSPVIAGDVENRRFDARRHKRNRDHALQELFRYTHYAMILSMGLSIAVVNVFGSLLLAPFLCWCGFYSSLQSIVLFTKTPSSDMERRLGILLRGFVVFCVLCIVCDSMTVAGWIVTHTLWSASLWIGTVVFVLLLRISVYLVGLTLACKRLSDVGETWDGVFVHVFGSTVLENGRVVGNHMVAIMNKKTDPWSPFGGRGIVLGIESQEATQFSITL